MEVCPGDDNKQRLVTLKQLIIVVARPFDWVDDFEEEQQYEGVPYELWMSNLHKSVPDAVQEFLEDGANFADFDKSKITKYSIESLQLHLRNHIDSIGGEGCLKIKRFKN